MGKTQLPAGYTGELIEVRQASDAVLAEVNELQNLMLAESRPELPGTPVAETINDVRKMRSTFEAWTVLIRDSEGRLVGKAAGGVDRTGDNEHAFEVELEVIPAHRRRGLATWALQEASRAAQAAGATLLLSWSDSAIAAGEAFARAAGFDLALLERESDLVLAELDWDMVERWVAEGPSRAGDYRLDYVEGLYPEDMYDDVIAWQHVMNTAPRDGLQVNDEHVTREQLAEWESRLAGSSKTRLEYQARHIESGACVGGSELFYEPWTPTVAWQGATAVHPDHRGHALGKWLKASMLLKVREVLPQLEIIRTGNAYSNDAMLGINNKLGFKETRAFMNWQADVEKVLRRLDG